MMEKGKKFVMAYSGGKDSALALLRLIRQGYSPQALWTTCHAASGRSVIHGIGPEVLSLIAEKLRLPLFRVITSKNDPGMNALDSTLARFKDSGVDICAFGDIDIQTNRDFWKKRCAAQGLEAIFPLWGEKRQELAYEVVDQGFLALIHVISALGEKKPLDERFLGQTLSRALIDEIAALGVDPSGENGEFHTLVYGGPLFQSPLTLRLGEILRRGQYSAISIQA